MKPTRSLALGVLCVLPFVLSGCGQYVARHFGGDISTNIPPGTQLVSMSWKGTDLWVLYFDPVSKTCVFKESSTLGVAEGSVTLKNCNPVALAQPAHTK